MLAEPRRGRPDGGLHVGEPDRVALGGMPAEDRMHDRLEVAAVRELRVVLEVAQVGDLRGVDARRLERRSERAVAPACSPAAT